MVEFWCVVIKRPIHTSCDCSIFRSIVAIIALSFGPFYWLAVVKVDVLLGTTDPFTKLTIEPAASSVLFLLLLIAYFFIRRRRRAHGQAADAAADKVEQDDGEEAATAENDPEVKLNCRSNVRFLHGCNVFKGDRY
jgi:hypothetical protein